MMVKNIRGIQRLPFRQAFRGNGRGKNKIKNTKKLSFFSCHCEKMSEQRGELKRRKVFRCLRPHNLTGPVKTGSLPVGAFLCVLWMVFYRCVCDDPFCAGSKGCTLKRFGIVRNKLGGKRVG